MIRQRLGLEKATCSIIVQSKHRNGFTNNFSRFCKGESDVYVSKKRQGVISTMCKDAEYRGIAGTVRSEVICIAMASSTVSA